MGATQELTARVAGRDWRLRVLADRTQNEDPMFGELWPVSLLLAERMAAYPAEGLRVLEAGCGLALPSLVLKSRGIDVTASDRQPEAGEFLAVNAALNGVAPVPFRLSDWATDDLGKFDLLIGADIVYETGQAEVVAGFLARHAAPGGTIVIADPGRRLLSRFRRLMQAQGRTCREELFPPRGRLLTFA